jgi:nitronate monooxygenase
MISTTLPSLRIRDRGVLPIIQGGMGVGISAHKLAGAVAREGAVGTIASVELRRLHPDIMDRTRKCRDHDVIAAGNLEALDREISAARAICGPAGFLAVNVMRAVKHYAELVVQACRSGADAIVMGAGLPFDLPDLARAFQDVALIPILSEERGIRALLKKWMRKGRLPDAIVIEHPGFAGGHLGATRVEEIADPRFDFARVFESARRLFKELGLSWDAIPLVPAGGINSFEKVKALFSEGAAAVQVGTPFAVTEEGDAHPNFKRVLTYARGKEIVTFLSAAGLPARAVLTPWLERYLRREAKVRAAADQRQARCPRNVECLSHCGLKDGNPAAGQFCIEVQLAAAQQGDLQRGLFFRGSEPLPFGTEIRPVRDLLELLLTGRVSGQAAVPQRSTDGMVVG